ncbi:hypothetical protein EVAR_34040_1 [Eumeta japonica]|uniref:Uncharacterized protein n=1 Tax=Eumeta variegata TaxID=151549 RepID=A0A4C1VTF3_EUMVA|nr:hypothetical protein EVAR_34040_1 [Eumeta japonica]
MSIQSSVDVEVITSSTCTASVAPAAGALAPSFFVVLLGRLHPFRPVMLCFMGIPGCLAHVTSVEVLAGLWRGDETGGERVARREVGVNWLQILAKPIEERFASTDKCKARRQRRGSRSKPLPEHVELPLDKVYKGGDCVGHTMAHWPPVWTTGFKFWVLVITRTGCNIASTMETDGAGDRRLLWRKRPRLRETDSPPGETTPAQTSPPHLSA